MARHPNNYGTLWAGTAYISHFIMYHNESYNFLPNVILRNNYGTLWETVVSSSGTVRNPTAGTRIIYELTHAVTVETSHALSQAID